MTNNQDLATIVVGAGQTGLSTAYVLRQHGIPCIVLDEDPRVGDQWRQRYDSLRLNTPAMWDGLPGRPFPGPRAGWPTGRDMGDHLESYAATTGLDVRCGMPVSRVEQCADGRWAVTARGEHFETRNVVIATGGEHHPRVPDVADQLDPGIRQLHSSDYHNPGQLLPGPVLVVGASQSGADLAMESVASGHQTWLSGAVKGQIPFDLESGRARVAALVLWFLANHVLTMRTPVGRRMQSQIRAGGTPLVRHRTTDLDAAGVRRVAARTVGATGGLPTLADGTVLDVANVLWCTGFRQDFSFIVPSPLGESGWPRDDGGVMPDLPGLYFVGLLFQSGFYSMLIGGAGRDAARVADHIARRERAGSRRAAGSGRGAARAALGA